jgi:tetratricopeptide (TPR) repeat protein
MPGRLNGAAEAKAIAEADALSAQGYIPEAVQAVEAAIATAPSARLYSHKARLNFFRRHYESAIKDVGAALKITPKDPELYIQRSELLTQITRIDEAVADLEAAAKFKPKDEWLRFARIRLLLFCNRTAEAEALVKQGLKAKTFGERLEARFYRGCLNMKRGKSQEALADLAFVIAKDRRDANLQQKARFYWLLAKAKDPAFRARYFPNLKKVPGKPKLYLCGLGLFPPYTATVDVLAAMASCDILANNISGHEIRELLAMFSEDVRPAMYDGNGEDGLWADRIMKHLEGGKTAAFVTRGHALVLGGLGHELVVRCKRRGIELVTFGAVTSIDTFLTVIGDTLGISMEGVQAYDLMALRKSPVIDTKHPLVAYFSEGNLGREQVKDLEKLLGRYYEADQACWMFGPKYDAPPQPLRLSELAERYPRLESSLSLFVLPTKN